MSDLEIFAALRRVAETFDRLGIGYYVGGSLASSLYGVPRATNDADVIAAIGEKDARAVSEALAPDFYVDEDMILDAIRRQGMFNVIHQETALKIDVYVLKPDAWHQEAFARRRQDSIEDGARQFSFGTAEDILLYKLVWFRMGGGVSERQWSDVLGVLRVQRDALDREYLDRWASVLEVADLLTRARVEARTTSP